MNEDVTPEEPEAIHAAVDEQPPAGDEELNELTAEIHAEPGEPTPRVDAPRASFEGTTREGGVELVRTFRDAGLRVPPVPEALTPTLRQLDRWLFATRPIEPMGTYFMVPYLHEAVTTEVEDYLAISHAGHGVNSYSLNYLLVQIPLVVMVQTIWGGVYTDGAKRRPHVVRERVFEQRPAHRSTVTELLVPGSTERPRAEPLFTRKLGEGSLRTDALVPAWKEAERFVSEGSSEEGGERWLRSSSERS